MEIDAELQTGRCTCKRCDVSYENSPIDKTQEMRENRWEAVTQLTRDGIDAFIFHHVQSKNYCLD